jgi:hypothetical protein
MSRAVRIALIAVIACGADGACGHPAPPPQPVKPPIARVPAADAGAPPEAVALDQDLPRLARRGSELLQQLAKVFAAVGEDCGAAVAKLVELKASYADVVRANAKVLHEGRAKELKAALEQYEDASSAAAKAIVESKTMAKCSADRAFTDAFDALVAPP